MDINEGLNLISMAVANSSVPRPKTRSNWATVETINPLTIILDEDASQTPREPSENAVGDLKVTQRVRISHEGNRLIISEAPSKVDDLMISELGGWGEYLPSTVDLNNFKTPGHWYNAISAEVATMTNAPPNNQAGALLVLRASGVIQYWHEYNVNATDGNVWRRRWYESTNQWSGWELYQGPAMFESGSNGDGSWVRFPSTGLQICWWQRYTTTLPINNAYGNLYLSTPQTWTYPRAFTATPSVSCGSFQWGTGASWGSIINVYGDYATYRGYDNVSRATGTGVNVQLSAIGWASS